MQEEAKQAAREAARAAASAASSAAPTAAELKVNLLLLLLEGHASPAEPFLTIWHLTNISRQQDVKTLCWSGGAGDAATPCQLGGTDWRHER